MSDAAASPSKKTRKRLVLIRALALRDGRACWYCNRELSEEEATLEHLCAYSHGGPTHLSNLVLACKPCNRDAGTLSVAKKVAMREKKRKKRGLA